jgi:hypothetical protein
LEERLGEGTDSLKAANDEIQDAKAQLRESMGKGKVNTAYIDQLE